MADYKRKGRRKRVRLIKGAINQELQPGALAADAAAIQTMNDTVVDRTWALSMEATWAWDGTAGEGPITVGVMHGDYNAVELEAYLESTTSWDEGNRVEQETRRRAIRTVGVFRGLNSHETLNDGRPIKTRLSYIMTAGQTTTIWLYNQSEGPLTTGGILDVQGHIWLKPI